MKRRKKVSFEYIEETRLKAGFFVDDICTELGISERSWYRWKKQNEAPLWVYKAIEIMSGRLDFFGWKRWYICDGVLYRDDLNPKYYSWRPEKLMEDLIRTMQPVDITFNQGHAHQTMVSNIERMKNIKIESELVSPTLSAIDAMKKIDEMA